MKAICLYLLICCSIPSALGQDSLTQILPAFIIKYNPVPLLYRLPALQFGLEHIRSDSVSLYAEVGWVNDAFRLDHTPEPSFENPRGFRTLVEWRLYQNLPDHSNHMHYFGAEIFYNSILYDRLRTFGFGCEALGACDYYRSYNLTIRQDQFGLMSKYGVQLVFARHFWLDINVGAGVQYDNKRSRNGPGTYDRAFGPFRARDDQHGFLPAISFALRLGYSL